MCFTDCSGNVSHKSSFSTSADLPNYKPLVREVQKVEMHLTDNGEDCVSLCFAIIYPFAVYIAADSRSSVGNGNLNVFTEDYMERCPEDDNYKKIFRLPFENKRIYGFSTGVNRFVNNTMTVSDIIRMNSAEHADTLIEQSSHLSNVFFQKKQGVSFVLIEYDNHNKCYKYVASDTSHSFIHINEYLVNSTKKIDYVCSGSSWAKLILNYVEFPTIASANTDDPQKLNKYIDTAIVKSIDTVFAKAYEASKIFDNSVGGEYHLLKITPGGGEEWLHGGYVL